MPHYQLTLTGETGLTNYEYEISWNATSPFSLVRSHGINVIISFKVSCYTVQNDCVSSINPHNIHPSFSNQETSGCIDRLICSQAFRVWWSFSRNNSTVQEIKLFAFLLRAERYIDTTLKSVCSIVSQSQQSVSLAQHGKPEARENSWPSSVQRYKNISLRVPLKLTNLHIVSHLFNLFLCLSVNNVMQEILELGAGQHISAHYLSLLHFLYSWNKVVIS